MLRNALLTILFLLFSLCRADSCSCVGLPPLGIIDYFEAEAIFVGKVINIEYGYMNVITFRVDRGYKNFKEKDTVEICTFSRTPGCGWAEPKINDTWLVFVRNSEDAKASWDRNKDFPLYGRYFVDYCDRLIKSNTRLFRTSVRYLEDAAARCDGYNVYKYPGSKIKCGEGRIHNGRPEGIWTFYSAKGAAVAIGAYKDGLKDSVWWQIPYLLVPDFWDRLAYFEYRNGELLFDGFMETETNDYSESEAGLTETETNDNSETEDGLTETETNDYSESEAGFTIIPGRPGWHSNG